MFGESVRGRRTLKCKVRACLPFTGRGRGKLSCSHIRRLIITVSTAASWLTNLKFRSYTPRQFHTTARKRKKNTKIMYSSYVFPRLTWQTRSLPPTKKRQGHITNSLVLQQTSFFFRISKTDHSEKLLVIPDIITCPNILPSIKHNMVK